MLRKLLLCLLQILFLCPLGWISMSNCAPPSPQRHRPSSQSLMTTSEYFSAMPDDIEEEDTSGSKRPREEDEDLDDNYEVTSPSLITDRKAADQEEGEEEGEDEPIAPISSSRSARKRRHLSEYDAIIQLRQTQSTRQTPLMINYRRLPDYSSTIRRWKYLAGQIEKEFNSYSSAFQYAYDRKVQLFNLERSNILAIKHTSLMETTDTTYQCPSGGIALKTSYHGVSFDDCTLLWKSEVNYGGKMHVIAQFEDSRSAAMVYNVVVKWMLDKQILPNDGSMQMNEIPSSEYQYLKQNEVFEAGRSFLRRLNLF